MVLMYHHIASGVHPVDFTEWQPAYDVSAASFASHVALFRVHVVPLKRLHVTFDDGYASLYREAWPLLEKNRMRCTCFVTTSAIGARGMLCREEIVALSNAGVQFGAHSHSHVFLAHLSRAELEREVLTPQKILADLLGKEVSTLSLPGGRYDETLLQYAQACGYREIFTSKPGYAAQTSRRFPNLRLWPRWVITQNTTHKELSQILRASRWHLAKRLARYRLGKLSKRVLGNRGYHFLWQNLQDLQTSFRNGRTTS